GRGLTQLFKQHGKDGRAAGEDLRERGQLSSGSKAVIDEALEKGRRCRDSGGTDGVDLRDYRAGIDSARRAQVGVRYKARNSACQVCKREDRQCRKLDGACRKAHSLLESA